MMWQSKQRCKTAWRSDTSQLARLVTSVPFADPPQDWLLSPTGAMPTIDEAAQAADVMYGLYAVRIKSGAVQLLQRFRCNAMYVR